MNADQEGSRCVGLSEDLTGSGGRGAAALVAGSASDHLQPGDDGGGLVWRTFAQGRGRVT